MFKITENTPTTLLKEFDDFINYIRSNEVTVGKNTRFISYMHLNKINRLMENPETEVREKSTQLSYPKINLFSNLALYGKLIKTQRGKSKLVLITTNKLDRYNELTCEEKYIFLLKTMLVECDFEKLQYQTYDWLRIEPIDDMIKQLSKYKPNVAMVNEKINIHSTMLLYLSYFGVVELIRDKESEDKEKGSEKFMRIIRIKSITITEFGAAIIKIISKGIEITKWNKYHYYGGIENDEMFYKKFKKLFNDNCLEKDLIDDEIELIEGNYIFKVSLSRNVWRKIEISSYDTLHDLHNVIQQAFEFDNDHLYAFFMDNKRFSKNRYISPYAEEGPYANEIKIEELSLEKNQEFMYLFDYGDEWIFNVKLTEIKEKGNIILMKPEIIESKGDAPNQYPSYDDDDWE